MPAASISPLLAGKRIVIVEDQALVQMHLFKLLTEAGLLVVGQAVDGDEALALLLRVRPDIALMDITMPGMTGIEVTRRATAELPVYVVMMTAHPAKEFGYQCFEAGARGYLVKPVTAAFLIPTLEALYEAKT